MEHIGVAVSISSIDNCYCFFEVVFWVCKYYLSTIKVLSEYCKICFYLMSIISTPSLALLVNLKSVSLVFTPLLNELTM